MVLKLAYRELLLESLSTHKYLTSKLVIQSTDAILKLDLSEKEYRRLIIHSYQNAWIGRNSNNFNLCLDEFIYEKEYHKIKTLLSQNSYWPEYDKIKPEKLPKVMQYYQFMTNFVYTVLEDNLVHCKILSFNEMLGVEYAFSDGDSKSYYEVFVKKFKLHGKVPKININ